MAVLMLCALCVPAMAAEPDYLCLTSTGNTTIAFESFPSSPDYKLEYSINNGSWEQATGDTEIPLRNGESVRFKANGTPETINNWQSVQFKMSGKGTVAASGSVMSLLSGDECFACCFAQLFFGCTNLTTAPKLPATTMAYQCYSYMFAGCTGLTTAPELPATTMATYCYDSMFAGCTGLTTAPALPATALASDCYKAMFFGCTGITTAPALPATTLAEWCYSGMFAGCSRLKTAPALPATTPAEGCYSGMFFDCTSLKITANKPTGCHYSEIYVPDTGCCDMMFAGVPGAPALSSGKTYYNPHVSGYKDGKCIDCGMSATGTGSTLSEGSMTVVVGVAAFAVGMAVMFFIMKKKKTAESNS